MQSFKRNRPRMGPFAAGTIIAPVLLLGLAAIAGHAFARESMQDTSAEQMATEQAPPLAQTMPPATQTPPADSAMPSFGTLDINADGAVEKSEIPAGHSLIERFDSLDTNGDGKLSQAEYDDLPDDNEEM